MQNKLVRHPSKGTIGFHSEEEAMMSNYLRRSIWHNNKILNECKATGDKYIRIADEMGIEELLQKSNLLLNA